jgi:hypothetical protein
VALGFFSSFATPSKRDDPRDDDVGFEPNTSSPSNIDIEKFEEDDDATVFVADDVAGEEADSMKKLKGSSEEGFAAGLAAGFAGSAGFEIGSGFETGFAGSSSSPPNKGLAMGFAAGFATGSSSSKGDLNAGFAGSDAFFAGSAGFETSGSSKSKSDLAEVAGFAGSDLEGVGSSKSKPDFAGSAGFEGFGDSAAFAGSSALVVFFFVVVVLVSALGSSSFADNALE